MPTTEQRQKRHPIPLSVRPVPREGDVMFLVHDSWLERGTVQRVTHDGYGLYFRGERTGNYGARFNHQAGRFEAGLLGFPLLRRLPPTHCCETGLPVSVCNCYQHCDNPDDLAERAREI